MDRPPTTSKLGGMICRTEEIAATDSLGMAGILDRRERQSGRREDLAVTDLPGVTGDGSS